MSLALYSSTTKQIEPFVSIKPQQVRMYVCGPTVYNDVHLGNLRPVIIFDCLNRLLRYHGYTVYYASNITDIDDKIIQRSLELGKSEASLTQRYTKHYLKLLHELNVLTPSYLPRATAYIPAMIGLIMSLLEKGYAYQTSSGVYFRVSSQPDYGSLSHRKVTEALDNYRISNDQQKEDPQDFALWKKTTEGLNFPSPFGEGRPGWHTECVAMNDAIFEHQTLDIHGGGMDLLFPHHENENAQFQALTGHPLAKTWMHCNFLNMGDAKMSKSLGNIKPGKEVVDEYGAMGTRLFLLSNHYRSPLKCEDSILQEFSLKGKNILKSLRGLALRLKIDASLADLYQTIPENEASLEAFVTILDADLNTATALSNIFEDQKKINQIRQLDSEGMILYKTWIKKLDLLGLAPRFRVTPEVVKTYQKYEEARKNQDYALSDKYRQILIEEGYL